MTMTLCGLIDGDTVLIAIPRYEGQTSWPAEARSDIVDIFTFNAAGPGLTDYRIASIPDEPILFVRVRNTRYPEREIERLAGPHDRVYVAPPAPPDPWCTLQAWS